jgi:glc operon protein GlcG
MMNNRGLSLADAQSILKEALDIARRNNFPPLTIALLDSGGHLKAFASEDGSGTQRGQIAQGKANAALGMGFGSGEFYSLVKNNVLPEMFAVCINGATNGQFIPMPGGVLIVKSGQILGALGISGASSEIDEDVAVSAIKSCEFTAKL